MQRWPGSSLLQSEEQILVFVVVSSEGTTEALCAILVPQKSPPLLFVPLYSLSASANFFKQAIVRDKLFEL